MRKTLALILSTVMILSLAAVGVSAADATEIKTAAEFAAMAADGNYKLGADITIAETYGAGDTATPFTGTFDGNGHTVTISAPMFRRLAGATVKNLTINGKIENAESNAASITYEAAGLNNVIENVVNNADINTTNNAAGLVGKLYEKVNDADTENSDGSITFKNCTNNGNITGAGHTAGFMAARADAFQNLTSSLTLENCTNNGSVSSTGAKKAVSGFLGNCSATNDKLKATITLKNLVNNGKISGTASGTAAYGGVAGIISAAGGTISISNCKNAGEIVADNAHTGGIVASLRTANNEATIQNCDSVGKITGTGNVGEIVGFIEKADAVTTIKNCYFKNAEGKAFGKANNTPTVEATPAAAPNFSEPVTPPAPVDPPATGDAMVWVVAAAIVSVLGMGVAVKAKNN